MVGLRLGGGRMGGYGGVDGSTSLGYGDDTIGLPWDMLPRDIVHLIVRQFYAAQVGGVATRHQWARGGVVRRGVVRRLARLQPLAAVNTAWRQATIPLLYGAVVCEQSDSSRARATMGWRTNLGLFAAGTMAKRARQLVVITRHGCDDADAVCVLLKQAGFARCRWPNLAAMLFLSQNELEGHHHQPPLPGLQGKAAVCAYVVSCLSRAGGRDACLRRDLPTMTTATVADLLSAGNNACRVDLRRPLPLLPAAAVHGGMTDSFSRTMPITCELSALAIPYVHARNASALGPISATLTDLRLLDIPPQCVWDVLDPDLQFPRLLSLALRFSTDAMATVAAAVPHWALTAPHRAEPFPRLQRLALSDPPVDVRECLNAIVVPGSATARLCRVEIETSATSVRSIMSLDAARQLPGTRALDIACIGSAPIAHDVAEAVAQRVLRTAPPHLQHLKLSLAARLPVHLGMENIGLRATWLRTLELRVPVALAQIVPVLQQLPNLWKLKVPYISTAELPSNEVRSLDKLYAQMTYAATNNSRKSLALANGVFATPISNSLEIAYVGFWDYRQSTRALCCHLLHFVLRIPSLQTLVHDSQSAMAMQSAIDALALMHQRQARWVSPLPRETCLNAGSNHMYPRSLWIDHLRNLSITTHTVKS